MLHWDGEEKYERGLCRNTHTHEMEIDSHLSYQHKSRTVRTRVAQITLYYMWSWKAIVYIFLGNFVMSL